MGKRGVSKYIGKFIIGQKFGDNEIVDIDISISNEAKVKCKCKCGNIRYVSCYQLLNGGSTKCVACGNSKKESLNPAWRGYGNISSKVYKKLIRDATIRGIYFNISIEYIDDLYIKSDKLCAISGLEISLYFKHRTASLDRIDSSKGYVPGNVQWVHKDINLMKNKFDQSYFIDMCNKISEYNKNI